MNPISSVSTYQLPFPVGGKIVRMGTDKSCPCGKPIQPGQLYYLDKDGQPRHLGCKDA